MISYVLIFVLGLLLLNVWMYFQQPQMIFFPLRELSQTPADWGLGYEDVTLDTADNVRLHGWYIPNPQSEQVLLFFHGNAGNISHRRDSIELFHRLGLNIFIIDYRGYGKSEGTISSQNQIFKDVQTVYENLKSRYNEDKIIVLGYSIGTGIATKLASKNNPKLLILQAPYYSMVDMMKRYYPIIPTFLLKYKFETNIYIKDCKVPIVIFHGNRDTVIPYESSRKIKELIKDAGTLIIMHGQGHNGMSNNMKYLTELKKILE